MVGCGNDAPAVSEVSALSSVVTTTSTTVDAQAGATPQASEEMANATATQGGGGGTQAGNKTPATNGGNTPASSGMGSTPSSSATPSGSSAAGQNTPTTTTTTTTTTTIPTMATAAVTITEDGIYDSVQEVGRYIHLYGKLPKNYVRKNQYNDERDLCAGGDRFYNKEGLLPAGQTYYECDIGTLGKTSRGSKRLVWTTSGIVYYTSDHYASFTQLYGAR